VLKPARTGPLTVLALPSASSPPASQRKGCQSSSGRAAPWRRAARRPRVRKLSITASTATGERIIRAAGLKKSSSVELDGTPEGDEI